MARAIELPPFEQGGDVGAYLATLVGELNDRFSELTNEAAATGVGLTTQFVGDGQVKLAAGATETAARVGNPGPGRVVLIGGLSFFDTDDQATCIVYIRRGSSAGTIIGRARASARGAEDGILSITCGGEDTEAGRARTGTQDQTSRYVLTAEGSGTSASAYIKDPWLIALSV